MAPDPTSAHRVATGSRQESPDRATHPGQVSTADVRVDAVALPSASPHRAGLTRRVQAWLSCAWPAPLCSPRGSPISRPRSLQPTSRQTGTARGSASTSCSGSPACSPGDSTRSTPRRPTRAQRFSSPMPGSTSRRPAATWSSPSAAPRSSSSRWRPTSSATPPASPPRPRERQPVARDGSRPASRWPARATDLRGWGQRARHLLVVGRPRRLALARDT
jgi:hypothetical protein